jgi:hypothetical protein
VGEKTRHGAGLFSMELLHDETTVTPASIPLKMTPVVSFECSDCSGSSDVFLKCDSAVATSKRMSDGESKDSVLYELTTTAPPSSCAAQAVAVSFFAVGNNRVCLFGVGPYAQECRSYDDDTNPVPIWAPVIESKARFEYRGAGIVDVTPSSGMINVGNDRSVISIVLESMGTTWEDRVIDLQVTLDAISAASSSDWEQLMYLTVGEGSAQTKAEIEKILNIENVDHHLFLLNETQISESDARIVMKFVIAKQTTNTTFSPEEAANIVALLTPAAVEAALADLLQTYAAIKSSAAIRLHNFGVALGGYSCQLVGGVVKVCDA